jgi:hypothetical protein
VPTDGTGEQPLELVSVCGVGPGGEGAEHLGTSAKLEVEESCGVRRGSRGAIVFAALAVGRLIEDRTGWSITRFVRTARHYRTVRG